MITATQTRDGNELPTLTFNDSLSALSHLIEKEIAFGGTVGSILDDLIEVETTVLGRVDVTRFKGPTDKMAPLTKFGRFHQKGEPTEVAVLKACGYPAIKVHVDLVSNRRPVDIIAAAQLAENGQQFREIMRAA